MQIINLLFSHKQRTILSLSRCAAVNIATLPRSRIYACLSNGDKRSAIADENGRSGRVPSSKSYIRFFFNLLLKNLFILYVDCI